MREITINENDKNQRLDRFMVKYLPKAPKSLINKYIRLKRIKVNKKRVESDYILKLNDKIQIYIYDEVLNEYKDNKVYSYLDYNLDIVYEDDNIAIINKPAGVLSHAASKEDYGKNIVDNFVSYLIKTKQYIPRNEKSFIPALSNRLDRNTSGLLIGCKNKDSLYQINNAIKNRKIGKYYITICKGKIEDQLIEKKITKKSENKMEIAQLEGKDSKTKVKTIINGERYSLVEVDLITGRTHQIRIHLNSIKHPIIGDQKYGDKTINRYFKEKYNLNYQLLHAYKLTISGLEGNLEYLNGKEYFSKPTKEYAKIAKSIFGEKYESIFRK
ncbi:RluA family pseudouridine synthase [Miniphocaeibacter massiliensis]|uniref:RluA family pseudouridine synthase n=1 Tax=Miniphocaeibacter massiliensis TaxID=2041841 RepID=UPI000C072CBE|nr:RluA family pseudouridine synthase [Miniphocaeibacter massiliensis]